MKTIEEQDHYEVLELPRGARKEDVERAYPLVRGAYESRSLALYSIYDEHSSDAIRERIDLAYRVLSDDEARRLYDESIGLEPRADPPAPRSSPADRLSKLPPLLRGAVQRKISTPGLPEVTPMEAPPAFAAAEAHGHEARTLGAIEEIEDQESNEFGGARLRRARLGAGLEIDDVSKITKIAPRHLQAIEDECFDELPADVYVRGFVSSFARTLGLDASAVARSYMQRLSEARTTEPVRRLFSR